MEVQKAQTVNLVTPFTFGGTEISKLTFRKPTTGECRGLRMVDVLNMDVDAIATLSGRICDELPSADAFYKLDCEDLVAVLGVVDGFFASAEKSPKK